MPKENKINNENPLDKNFKKIAKGLNRNDQEKLHEEFCIIVSEVGKIDQKELERVKSKASTDRVIKLNTLRLDIGNNGKESVPYRLEIQTNGKNSCTISQVNVPDYFVFENAVHEAELQKALLVSLDKYANQDSKFKPKLDTIAIDLLHLKWAERFDKAITDNHHKSLQALLQEGFKHGYIAQNDAVTRLQEKSQDHYVKENAIAIVAKALASLASSRGKK